MLKTMRAHRNSEYSRHENHSVWRSLKNFKKNTVHQFHYQVLIQRKKQIRHCCVHCSTTQNSQETEPSRVSPVKRGESMALMHSTLYLVIKRNEMSFVTTQIEPYVKWNKEGNKTTPSYLKELYKSCSNSGDQRPRPAEEGKGREKAYQQAFSAVRG